MHRIYDEPKTPYQRLRQAGVLTRKQGAELESRYEALNPAKLHRDIQLLRNKLFDLVESKGEQGVPPNRQRGPSIELNRARKRRLSAAAD